MSYRHRDLFLRFRARSLEVLTGPQMVAFLPAVALAAYWFGGEAALIVASVCFPVVYMALGGFAGREGAPARSRDSVTGLALRDSLRSALDHALRAQAISARKTACLMIEIDDFAVIADRYGQKVADNALRRTGERLRSALREGDLVCRLDGASFGIAIAPVLHLDLESAIQLASRLQSVVEEPISVDATAIYLSCSIGFCLGGRSPLPTGAALMSATQRALQEAVSHAPSAIRAYSPELAQRRGGGFSEDEVARALDNGQIVPFFQPQISTDTGRVTGFEALARWNHPERGLVPPAEFLPAFGRTGQMERLGDLMLVQSLVALRRWDEAGLDVPRVGVNFCGAELRNPRLIDKVRWQLDRYGISPHRLTVEVLETVLAGAPEDLVSRNINGLAELGCHIDLDDFGTGHASISSIRRLPVERLKIDRSFVMKVDRDIDQQRMVSAILTMAERLGLSTLAEGVETPGEHAMVAQLGCEHVQGFGIARPMPFEQTIDWVRRHDASIGTPLLGRSAS